MRKSIKIVWLLILLVSVVSVYAQNSDRKLVLFADRNYCISGDTLWFKVFVPEELNQFGNVVHVQFETETGNLVASVTQKSGDSIAEGFIPVPDSLGTGLCYLTAFLNAQRINPNTETIGKSVYVYNRFEEHISQMKVPHSSNFENAVNGETFCDVKIDKSTFKGRELVKCEVISNGEEVRFAIVNARIIDPFSDKNDGFINFVLNDSSTSIPPFAENNGVLISGVVRENNRVPDARNLVLLSITEEPPYFDYYYSGKDGDFHFFLQNAIGDANIILQTLGESEREYDILPVVNQLKRTNNLRLDTLVFTADQTKFVDDCLKNNFYSKLFNRQAVSAAAYFSMPSAFDVPFYGNPTKHIVPDEFIDLPDFKEISRELLSGFQYRTKNDETTFRLLNLDQEKFFDEQPLRLLNGIPVFKNSFFSSLASADIRYVDLVQSERVFGDLKFNGILAVSLYNQSNSWLAQQSNVFLYERACLQPAKVPDYVNKPKVANSEPDVRQNFLWNVLENNTSNNFSFYLSDVEGWVEISVEGITKSNKVFKTSKRIEVK
ncbi:hypothetical protein [uncultured Draconibacterium sp.]|uniref:hypothetical protein n=1 Tax=uncultured Draconibacterium sp. TaxID=1573823 RepID=UPI0032163EDD